MNIENIIERVKELLEDPSSDIQLQELLNAYHSADLAEILETLKPEERLRCFLLIDDDKAPELLSYLSAQYQVEILSEIDEQLASKLILKMPHDEVADVLGDMGEDESANYLNKLPQKLSNQIRELLTYKDDTAGGIMNPRVLTANQEMLVKDALDYIRNKASDENIELYYLYVTDKQNHLLGVVSFRTLMMASLKTKLSEIMTSDLIKLHIDEPQDSVADIFMKYQYNALPVVDLYNRLKGVVTWDDVQDVVEEETTEDFFTSSGITTNVYDDDEILSGNIFNSVRARTPWLFITLIGEFFAVNVANAFDSTIAILPVTAIFMPLLAGLGGNIGTQSITLMVRGLSTGQVSLKTALSHVLREFAIGLIIGVLFGALVMMTTIKWQHNVELGLVVGAAMIINMALATLIGTITPFMLKFFKIDPAIASGPVIATTIDVVGLAIYFTLVSVFLLKTV